MDILRESGALLLVAGLLFAAVWIAKNGKSGILRISSRSSANRTVNVLERVSLTPQHQLHLVHAGDRDLLLVTYPQGCVLIRDQVGTERTDA